MSFRQRSAVVVVEDAHWADDASLDILRYLARRVERLPAMLVISYRDQELADEHPLRRIIGALAGPAVLQMELEGLSDAAVAKLATEVGLAPGPVVAAGAEPSRLVHHAVGAGDEDAVVRYATAAAAEAAEAEAHREVAAFARLALKRSPRLDDLEVARLHGLAAAALYALNRFGEAAHHAHRAVQLWDASGCAPLELGEALLISARMSLFVADPASARAKALRALEILEPLGPSRALALCYSSLGAQDALQVRFEAAAWSQRALDLAQRIGSVDVVAHALGYRGLARASLGDEGASPTCNEPSRPPTSSTTATTSRWRRTTWRWS